MAEQDPVRIRPLVEELQRVAAAGDMPAVEATLQRLAGAPLDPSQQTFVQAIERAFAEYQAARQRFLDADKAAADPDRALVDVSAATAHVATQRAYRAQLKQIARENATSPADYEARLAEARQRYEAGHAAVNQERAEKGLGPVPLLPFDED